ncbi:hypothetical protein [Parasphingorhabdus sp.]
MPPVQRLEPSGNVYAILLDFNEGPLLQYLPLIRQEKPYPNG